MSARQHACQREHGGEADARQQPAAAHDRRAQPAESHDERGGGDMAADEGAVCLALVGRDESRRELSDAAELLDPLRAGTPGVVFQRRIDQQYRAEQAADKEEAEQYPARLQRRKASDETQCPEYRQDDDQRLSDARQSMIRKKQPGRGAMQCPRPVATVEQAAGRQIDLRKGDEEHGQQAECQQRDAKFSSP